MPDQQPARHRRPVAYPQQIIAFTIVMSFVSVLFLWSVYPPQGMDPTALTVVNILTGALVTKFGSVVDFYFGSSQGEKEKGDVQNQMVANMTVPGATPAVVAAAVRAAEVVAPAAAEAAAPAAAAEAAPPAAEAAAPAAAERAVNEALDRRKDP